MDSSANGSMQVNDLVGYLPNAKLVRRECSAKLGISRTRLMPRDAQVIELSDKPRRFEMGSVSPNWAAEGWTG
jgi:hypothetical protein